MITNLLRSRNHFLKLLKPEFNLGHFDYTKAEVVLKHDVQNFYQV